MKNLHVLSFSLLGEKDYGRVLKEDRYKGFDPRPESFRKETTSAEIDTFLLRCKDKDMIDKKSEKPIHSNWRCLYSKIDMQQDIDLEEFIQDPLIGDSFDKVHSLKITALAALYSCNYCPFT